MTAAERDCLGEGCMTKRNEALLFIHLAFYCVFLRNGFFCYFARGGFHIELLGITIIKTLPLKLLF